MKTIEGIRWPLELHPIQAARMANQVLQYGYCRSGQIMSAVALLERRAVPTAADIDRAMWGNISRRDTYPRTRRAMKGALEDARAILQTPAKSESPSA